MTLTYYAVYVDEDDPVDQPVGLYRRDVDPDGRVTLAESYHPRTGWSPTDYWRRLQWDGVERHLVEVDEQRAQIVQDYFVAVHAGPDNPQA